MVFQFNHRAMAREFSAINYLPHQKKKTEVIFYFCEREGVLVNFSLISTDRKRSLTNDHVNVIN